MTNRDILARYGYRIAPRVDALAEAPQAARIQQHVGAWCAYDPDDDADGWLLVGDDADALAAETVQMIRDLAPVEGPLAKEPR